MMKDKTEIAKTLHTKLAAIRLIDVPMMSMDRSIPRKEQARLARELFKTLGLKGISVTTPNYSMARTVHVDLPERQDVFERSGKIDYADDPARQANLEARQSIRLILLQAFPNHDDRSDTQSDHFDYCWSVR
jgi:hypothetical protein